MQRGAFPKSFLHEIDSSIPMVGYSAWNGEATGADDSVGMQTKTSVFESCLLYKIEWPCSLKGKAAEKVLTKP